MTSYKRDYKSGRLKSHAGIFIENMYLIKDNQMWSDDIAFTERWSTHDNKSIKSLKAFKRYVRHHSKYLSKGTEIILCTNWIGVLPIVATIKGNGKYEVKLRRR